MFNFVIKVLRSKNKFKRIQNIFASYSILIKSSYKLRRYKLLPQYFLSDQYKQNTWSFDQCFNYSNDFLKFYFHEDFFKNSASLFEGFDKDSSSRLKFVLLRMMFFSFLRREDFFSNEEKSILKEQQMNKNSVKFIDKYYCFKGYKFINNNITFHNFYDDLGLLKIKNEVSLVKNKDIIDVGAYIGDSALILSNYTNKNIYAFEPFEEAFNELTQNIDINNNKNIVPVNKGCSDKNGLEKLYFGQKGDLSISANDPDKALSKGALVNFTEVDVVTIDSFSAQNGLDIGVIKIDAEGAEQSTLRGAIKTIKNKKPILLISIYHNVDDFFSIKSWVENLALGYRYKITKPEATTFIEETMLICYQ